MHSPKHSRIKKSTGPKMSPDIRQARRLCNYAVETNNFGMLVPALFKCKWTQQVAIFHHLFSIVPSDKVQYAVNLFDEFVTDVNWVYLYFLLQAQRDMYSRVGMRSEAEEVSGRISKILMSHRITRPL